MRQLNNIVFVPFHSADFYIKQMELRVCVSYSSSYPQQSMN
jgi:hypothetical protein